MNFNTFKNVGSKTGADADEIKLKTFNGFILLHHLPFGVATIGIVCLQTHTYAHIHDTVIVCTRNAKQIAIYFVCSNVYQDLGRVEQCCPHCQVQAAA